MAQIALPGQLPSIPMSAPTSLSSQDRHPGVLDGQVLKPLRVPRDLRSISMARPGPSLQGDLVKLGPGGEARQSGLAGGCWRGLCVTLDTFTLGHKSILGSGVDGDDFTATATYQEHSLEAPVSTSRNSMSVGISQGSSYQEAPREVWPIKQSWSTLQTPRASRDRSSPA